jgi:hypothetical protein
MKIAEGEIMLKSIRRTIGVLALVDGIGTLVSPQGYLRRLETGAPMVDDILDYLADNPDLARKISVLEIAFGAWLTFA